MEEKLLWWITICFGYGLHTHYLEMLSVLATIRLGIAKNLLEYVESCDRDSFPLPDFYSNIPHNTHIYFCVKLSQSLKKFRLKHPAPSPLNERQWYIFSWMSGEKNNHHHHPPKKIQTIPGKKEVLNIHQNRSKIWIMEVGRSIWMPFLRKYMLASGLTAQTISWASTAEGCHTSGDLTTNPQFRYIPSSSSLPPARISVSQAEQNTWHKKQELMAHIVIAYNDTHACSPWIRHNKISLAWSMRRS